MACMLTQHQGELEVCELLRSKCEEHNKTQ